MDQQTTLADDELWGAPAPGPALEGGRSHARRWIAAVLGSAAIGVAAVVGANLASSGTQNLGAASPGGGQGGFGGGRAGGFGGGPGGGANAAGTITGIDGSTLTMATQAGATVKVVAPAATIVSISATGTPSDVRIGDNVRVIGTTSDGTVAAQQISDTGSDAPPAGPGAGAGPGGPGGAGPAGAARPPAPGGQRPNGGPATSGVVTAVGTGSLSLSTADGTTLTVATTPATVVTLVHPGTVRALKVGDQIQVTGQTATDGTITANAIRAGAVPGRAGP